MRSAILLVTVVMSSVAVAAGGAGRTTTMAERFNRPSAIFPAGDFAHGKELAEPCLACHGESAPMIGDPPIHQPKLLHQHPAAIFYALADYKNGTRKSDVMAPIVAGLSEQDMRDLSVYLSGPPAVRSPRPPGMPPSAAAGGSAGRTKNIQHCGFCHGLTGQGVIDGVPVVGGQHQDYLKHALAAYASGSRSNATMRAAVKGLTPQEIEDVTSYLAAQSTLGVAR
jgi:cytochrome c553